MKRFAPTQDIIFHSVSKYKGLKGMGEKKKDWWSLTTEKKRDMKIWQSHATRKRRKKMIHNLKQDLFSLEYNNSLKQAQ